ncbi:MAG: relaxase/mobilization nuclease domain-containing protein [Limisphaerales bacterium]
MIIKGRSHGNAGNLARYLLTTKPGEKEFVMDLRDAASDDIRKALTDWEAIAHCSTKGDKTLYHAHIRLRDGEALKEAQWFEIVQRMEEKLGFTNCARAVIGHNNEEKGLHVHVVWSRFDPVSGKLVSMSKDRKQHHAIARQAEKEFGLEPVPEKAPERTKRRLSDRDVRALKDRTNNRDKLEKIVRAAWTATEGGEEMKSMLNALGVDIQRGDRRDFVIEYKGLKMNPVRLLDDVSTAEFRERMKDAEIEKPREKSPAEVAFGRKARGMAQGQFDKSIANDQAEPPAKTGFTKKKHKAPAPRLKPKLRFRDPGI